MAPKPKQTSQSDSDDFTERELAKKRPILPLKAKDGEKWFKMAEQYLRARGKFYVIEKLRKDYCMNTSSSAPIFGNTEDPDRVDTWEKDSASVDYLLSICLDDFDQELIADFKTVKEKWETLKIKYSKTLPSDSRGYMQKISNFTFTEGMKIDEAWLKLTGYRRKLVPTQKALFTEDALFEYLLAALPDGYEATLAVLDTSTSLTVPEKISHLETQQTRISTKETGMVAKRFKRSNSIDSDVSTRRATRSECWGCQGKDHYWSDCPYKSKIIEFGIKVRELDESKTSKHRYKKDQHRKPKEANRKTRQPDKPSKSKRSRGYKAESETDPSTDSSSSTTESEDISAGLGAIDLDDSDDEIATIARNVISKIPPSEWYADSGASSHMTDKLHLFRTFVKINRRQVKVGGGVLVADYMGTVEMRMKDGRSVLLSAVLWVPGLGVNLLSARKICMRGLKAKFDDKEMVFSLHGKSLITASVKGGVFIVNKLAKGLEECAYLAANEAAPLSEEPLLDGDINMDDEQDTSKETKRIYELWHRRLGHLNPKFVRSLHKVTTLKKRIKVPVERDMCDTCNATKMTDSINRELSQWATVTLHLISIDVAGPFPASWCGNRWLLQIIDNATRRVWSIPMKTKDQALDELPIWRAKVELETGLKVHKVRLDNAPELLEIATAWSKKDGVEVQPTVVATSHSNGVAERHIRISEMQGRAMLKDAKLPLEFWDEAMVADAYVRNRMQTGPIQDGQQISPYQAYFNEKPSANHLRVWGSKCWSWINPKTLPAKGRHDKLMDTGRVGVFVGYVDETTTQYRIYAPDLGYVVRRSVVRIDETTPGGIIDLQLRSASVPQGTAGGLIPRNPRGRPRKNADAAPPALSIMSSPEAHQASNKTSAINITQPPAEQLAKYDDVEEVENPTDPTSTALVPMDQEPSDQMEGLETEYQSDPVAEPKRQSTEPAEDAPEAKRQRSNSHRAVPVNHTKHVPRTHERYSFRKRKFEDTFEDEDDSGRVAKIARAMLAWINEHGGAKSWQDEVAYRGFEDQVEIPIGFRNAMSDPLHSQEWKEAVAEELASLARNDTFEEVIPPKGANLVTTKWVFDVKRHADNTVERFKARLVARGFSQVLGQDYFETFAPTVRADTLRIFLAIVASEDLECTQFDIKNAFTESHIQETIYLAPPEGLPLKKGYALKVKRSLYGLKQAARNWNKMLRDYLLEIGFEQSQADPCLFTHEEKELIILTYVDDIPCAGKSKENIKWFYKTLHKRFNTKSLGELGESHKILGLRVTRDRKQKTIHLDQEQYIENACRRFGFDEATKSKKPIPLRGYDALRPSTDEDIRVDRVEYQQGIGSVMWAMIMTRPDIAFAVGRLAQYMKDPSEHHASALKNLFRYLKSTATQRICYQRGSRKERMLKTYSDADYASDKTDRVSISGHVEMLCGGPIAYGSRKQKSVATATTESEYIAMSGAAKLGQWTAQVLRDMGYGNYIGKDPKTVTLFGDNTGALALVKNPHLHERSKHIDVAYHFIRDLQEKKKIDVSYIPTAEMIADGMTKPLDATAFKRFKDQLGLVDCPGQVGAEERSQS